VLAVVAVDGPQVALHQRFAAQADQHLVAAVRGHEAPQVEPRARTDAALQAAAQRVASAARRLASGAAGLAIVHGDLVPANLLDGAELWLLDWEYAQVADPIFDLGCLLAYHPELRAGAPRLLDAAGLGGARAATRLAAAIEVYEGLSALWLAARGAAGPQA